MCRCCVCACGRPDSNRSCGPHLRPRPTCGTRPQHRAWVRAALCALRAAAPGCSERPWLRCLGSTEGPPRHARRSTAYFAAASRATPTVAANAVTSILSPARHALADRLLKTSPPRSRNKARGTGRMRMASLRKGRGGWPGGPSCTAACACAGCWPSLRS